MLLWVLAGPKEPSVPLRVAWHVAACYASTKSTEAFQICWLNYSGGISRICQVYEEGSIQAKQLYYGPTARIVEVGVILMLQTAFFISSQATDCHCSGVHSSS